MKVFLGNVNNETKNPVPFKDIEMYKLFMITESEYGGISKGQVGMMIPTDTILWFESCKEGASFDYFSWLDSKNFTWRYLTPEETITISN